MRGHLAEVERAAIVAALEAEDQNQTRAGRRFPRSIALRIPGGA